MCIGDPHLEKNMRPFEGAHILYILDTLKLPKGALALKNVIDLQ
jgi:hypothetical protein